jgi:chromosome segregation ATPase
MKANIKILSFLILAACTLLVTGCRALQEPAQAIFNPEPARTRSNAAMSAKRFTDTAPKGQSAVDSAITLAKKHAELSEKTAVLQQKNHELVANNQQLKDRIAALEPELNQANKELAEANDLLIEMRIELNNWKTNILGFRDEMRDADKTQLQALLRILKVLGGEVNPEVSTRKNPDSTGSSPNAQSKPQSKQISISSEQNE